MSLFDFAREAGETLREKLSGKPDMDARELAKALQDHGVTLRDGRITVADETVTVTGEASNQQERELAILVLGNTKGVAHVDDQITIAAQPAAAATPAAGAAPSTQATFYTVKSGDTLSKIAQAHYGDATRYGEIFEANRPMLKDPDKIYPGQALRIPGTTRH
ncbi:peptidoglycan-binding protein LysM [Phenylobacterium sp.]|uniref:peptidoglycan-binding protein LysM n=1 Tax=Phenylobacterium sp. TaxID=1871053 RepID=UPI002737398D|nr:peptidoglycan-binding protein LysM [Phenylobacterium sp.]MDP3853998.1 peptidoglycan-binding protein LysM [Phenylobacterium sp.]